MFVFCSGSTPGSSAQSSEDEYEESNYVNQPVSRSDSPTFSFSLETSAQSLSSSFQMGLVNHWRPHRAFTFLHNDARPVFFVLCFFLSWTTEIRNWDEDLKHLPPHFLQAQQCQCDQTDGGVKLHIWNFHFGHQIPGNQVNASRALEESILFQRRPRSKQEVKFCFFGFV